MDSVITNNLFENVNRELNLKVTIETIDHYELMDIALGKIERNIIALASAYRDSLKKQSFWKWSF